MQIRLLIAVATLLVVPASSDAAILFQETFDTNTANALTSPAYSAFSLTAGSTPVQVVSGVLEMAAQGPNVLQEFSIAGFAGDLLISVDLGKTLPTGDSNVGLKIGGNNIVFHPGYSPPDGAIRVEGPGGFGNTSLGFVPAAGSVLHHLEVRVTAATGHFDIKLTDANNPLNVFTTSFTNAGYAAGDRIGLTVHGDPNTGFSRFDNLRVESLPEPTACAAWLFTIAGLGAVQIRRRKPAVN